MRLMWGDAVLHPHRQRPRCCVTADFFYLCRRLFGCFRRLYGIHEYELLPTYNSGFSGGKQHICAPVNQSVYLSSVTNSNIQKQSIV